MLCDDSCRTLEKRYVSKDLLAMERMKPHLRPLYFVKSGRFVKDRIGHADLSHIVKKGSKFEIAHRIFGEPKFVPEPQAEGYGPFGMTCRFKVTGLESLHKRL